MKRLVLLGEGHGDEAALPVLVRKLLREKDSAGRFFVDHEVIRESSPVKWNKEEGRPDFAKWVSRVTIALRRGNLGGVLAVYDGDAPTFPAGSGTPFCAGNAAKVMARAAAEAGAGKTFSLAVVFACVEYESWIIAGIESLAGKRYKDGRPALPTELKFPPGDRESHGKRWLEQHYRGYRPTLDQSALTDLLDLGVVRAKGLRSFRRLEHALDQLLDAASKGTHISTPV
jgi:Domain of unknown function (DUF4276)